MAINDQEDNDSGLIFPSAVVNTGSGSAWSNINNLLTGGTVSATINTLTATTRYANFTFPFRTPANAQTPFRINVGPTQYRCVIFRIQAEARCFGSVNNPVLEFLGSYRNKKNQNKFLTFSNPIGTSFTSIDLDVINSFTDISSDPDDVQADFSGIYALGLRIRDSSVPGSATCELRNVKAAWKIYRETFPLTVTGAGIN